MLTLHKWLGKDFVSIFAFVLFKLLHDAIYFYTVFINNVDYLARFLVVNDFNFVLIVPIWDVCGCCLWSCKAKAHCS